MAENFATNNFLNSAKYKKIRFPTKSFLVENASKKPVVREKKIV
jgi:hypothetical protein